MSIKNFFSRTKKPDEVITSQQITSHDITCDTKDLKEFITNWTKNEGWNFEIFSDFLKLIGVKTPVKLSELNRETNSFTCFTALGTEVLISLRFSDFFECCSEIHITEGNETRVYIPNCNIKKESIPHVTLSRRILKSNGKELISYYCEYFCNRTLKIDDTHTLKVEIYEPKYDEKSGILVLQNCKEIEDYLLGLDNSLGVSEVYDNMMQFLGFSSKEILNSEKINISYTITIDKKERVLSKILIANGKLTEYAISENGDTYHLFKDGSWKYFANGIEILYSEEKKYHVLSMTGTENEITNANLSETMSRVKEKIAELQKIEFVIK